MQPRKDYDDYTKFINDTFAAEKEGMLSGTVEHMNRTGGFKTMSNPMDTLKTQSEKDLSLMNRAIKSRGFGGRKGMVRRVEVEIQIVIVIPFGVITKIGIFDIVEFFLFFL